MKILITGAGGYIGSVTTQLFLQRNFEVVAIDNFSTGFKKPLQILQQEFGKGKLRFYEADIADDLNTILEKEDQIDVVVHFAGFCLVDDSMKNPQKYFQNNVCGSLNLLTLILKYNINNVVFSSTCSIYGETDKIPIKENHPVSPANPYSQSKKMVEEIIKWYSQLLGLNYIILRYFNVCGASDDGLFGDSKKPSPHLVQNAVRASLGIDNFLLTCPEVNTPDETPVRDYINVVDLSEAHVKAVNYLVHGGKNEIINLGTGKGNSVLEIIMAVQKITGTKFELKLTNQRIGESSKLVASIDKVKQILDWQPQRTLENSIKSLAAWYKKYPQGWDN